MEVAERRRDERFASDRQTACQPLSGRGDAAWTATVRNISRTGIALALSRRFERGTLLSVQLDSPAGTGARRMFARVVHVRAEADGNWVMGCAFAGQLDADELTYFQVERRRPEDLDCRTWVRFDCDIPAEAWVLRDGQAEPMAIRVINVLPGGLGLLAPQAVATGTFLRLELPGEEGESTRLVQVRVIQSLNKDDQNWILGCELAAEIGDDEPQALASETPA
jgi:hypothetical protein